MKRSNEITALPKEDKQLLEQAAVLLNQAFPLEDGYPTMADAREEVQELLAQQSIVRIWLEDGELLGIIGAQSTYNGKSWELHPLVVRHDKRGRGIGAKLAADLEEQISRRGGGTLYLGTDDVAGQTSIGNKDLYPGVLTKLLDIESIGGHPFQFYLKQGFEVVGCLPDVNGPGKPDIMMAKYIPNE